MQMFSLLRRSARASAIFLACLPLSAQSTTAGLVGIVRDETGASVPSAAVRVRNTDTNALREAVSDNIGGFDVPNLAPGSYDVSVEKSGFQLLRETGLVLRIGQTARLELQLKVGAVSEMVEVGAQAPLVNTENSSKGDVVVAEELAEMPLDGRNFEDLAFLVPGVLPKAEGEFSGPFAINGARSDGTNFYLDGFSNREPRFGNAQASPNLDAMQEFKLETSGFSAEYGRLAGGVMSVVLKSGGNQLHGSVFEFLRNDKFDARNFFANNKNKLRRNQFGTTVSGPVYLPRLYDGRNRTLFLFSWESFRDSTGQIQLSRVPTALERQGDFSQTRDAAGRLVQLRDPFAANAPIPGNRIPLDRMNPISQKILPYWPLPNRPEFSNNYIAGAVGRSPWNSFMWKFDQTISARDSFAFRFLRRDSGNTMPFPGASPLGTFPTVSENLSSLAGLNATHLFSATLINEFRVSLSRNPSHVQNVDAGRNYTAEFGIAGATADPHQTGFPLITVRDLATVGDKADRPMDVVTNLYQLSDTLTWVKGRHQVKFGGEIVRSQTFQPYYNNPRGTFNFQGNWTSQPFADFLLGLLQTASRQSTPPQNYLFTTDYSAFVQDDFKITPRLTLNLGLRYELPGTQYDKYGRYSGFVPSLGKIIVADDRAVPNFNALIGGAGLSAVVGVARDYGIPSSLVEMRYRNLAPRFGFAWRPLGGNRMVLRGGYGIFTTKSAQNPMTQQMANVFPFAISQSVFRAANNPNPAAIAFSDPFANAGSAAVSIGGYDMHAPMQYLQSWNLTIERELPKLGAVEVAYAGSKGTHLSYSSDINRPYYSLNMRQPDGSFPRPYPQINNAISYMQFGGNSIYNSGMVTLRRRFAGGFFYRINYVYAKSLDYNSMAGGANQAGARQIQDPNNLAAERGRSSFDIGHSLTMNFSYQIPWRSSTLRRLMRGWQVAGSGRAYTGQPFTPVNSNFNLALGTATRPDRLAKGTVPNPTPERWYDRSAFAVVPDGSYRFGSSGRDILDGPGFMGINLSLYKNIQVWERGRMQFRWEAFNALNHANFRLPNTSVNAINGGTITATSEARTMQLGLRYEF